MAGTQYPKGPAFTSYSSNSPAPMMQQSTIPPRPFFFIARSNGLLVPLIPADELPFNVRLQGVQRVMPIEQTYGMQCVGSAPYTGMTYKLEQDISTPMQRSTSQPPGGPPNGHVRSQSNISVNPIAKYLAPDALARQALAQSGSNAAAAAMNRQAPAAAAHEIATSWRSNYQPSTASQSAPAKNGDKTQSLIDAILSSAGGAEEAARLGYVPKPSITPPSGALPDQDKKEYCTYWIRTGECDYIQQGCLYKHEMPDRATLSKIGFRTLPRWWAEKQTLMQGPGEQKERTLVGPVLKASEWLKKTKSGSDDSSSEDSGSERSSRKSSVSSTQETIKQDKPEEKPTPEVKPIRTLPSYTASPPLDRVRQASTMSDLIDFAAPTAPSSPSSIPASTQTTPCLTPANSTKTSPRLPSTPPTPISAQTKTPTSASAPAPEPVKVFVPRGENAEYHIAEATKKRNHQQLARRGAPVSTLGAVKPLEVQIQESQKARSGGKTGLTASRHARPRVPASAPVLVGCSGGGAMEAERRGRSLEKKDGLEKRRSARTGCRPRRPAGSSGGAGGKGKGKGKESTRMMGGEVVGGAEKK
ncbi:hypothetical protein EJ03DRAFT_374743 [Teratosphaeria nubilosa]|uniref:C3H1-type domain-containing protein n=1 Tax=Teratosphaeria nubilosa TaxID=161662 RepID=A0A6G1L908_9PEZI|nr:hypothetical protein EJ03DRAFT_374743 [Teratosphaeria nubilosa]